MRDNIVSVRFNEKELKELQDRAKSNHLKLSSYIRYYMFCDMFSTVKTHEEIVRISRGVPKRIDDVRTIKEIGTQKELMNEIKEVFEGGVKLKSFDEKKVRLEIMINRKKKPKKTLEELKDG